MEAAFPLCFSQSFTEIRCCNHGRCCCFGFFTLPNKLKRPTVVAVLGRYHYHYQLSYHKPCIMSPLPFFIFFLLFSGKLGFLHTNLIRAWSSSHIFIPIPLLVQVKPVQEASRIQLRHRFKTLRYNIHKYVRTASPCVYMRSDSYIWLNDLEYLWYQTKVDIKVRKMIEVNSLLDYDSPGANPAHEPPRRGNPRGSPWWPLVYIIFQHRINHGSAIREKIVGEGKIFFFVCVCGKGWKNLFLYEKTPISN